MSAPRILLVYGTSYGQTARIASRMRQYLSDHGFIASLWKGDLLPPDLGVTDYDGVIVGASMIRKGYQKYVRDFVVRHAAELNAAPSAFFAVSGSAGSQSPLERQEAHRLMEEFCSSCGWRPALTASVAGAIAYTKYNVVVRWVMRRISAKEGRSTDTSRDHEYTDWTQVEQFAEHFATLVHDHAEHARAAQAPDGAQVPAHG
jgi:menaquinone-dependent protoporphyrinogen oxidase